MISFILSVAEITLTMSAVVALVLMMSRLFGARFSAKCRYVVWMVVMLRLALPFGAPFVPALINVELLAEEQTAKEPIMPTVPETQTKPEPLVSVVTPESSPVNITPSVPGTEITLPESDAGGTAPAEDGAGTARRLRTALTVTGWIWFAGAAAAMGVQLIAYYLFATKLNRRAMLADGEIAVIYAELCEKYSIRCAPALYVSDAVASPLLYGFLRPRVIMSTTVTDPGAAALIFSHELTHHRRGDLWVKLLCAAAASIHWFNPLVWLALRRCDQEMELSCDEAVLSSLNESARRSYGEVMLDTVRRCKALTDAGRSGTAYVEVYSSLSTHYSPRKNAVIERFKNILDTGRKRRGAWIIAAAVILCALAGMIVACRVGGDSQTGTETVNEDEITAETLWQNYSQENAYTRYDLKVPLPGEYEGVVTVTPQEELDENVIIELYHTATLDTTGFAGWLYSITRCTAEELVTDAYNTGSTYYFAQDGGWYYALMRPTSVEANLADEASAAEYDRLAGMYTEVIEAFISANGLSPFSSADIDSAKGYVSVTMALGDAEDVTAQLSLPAEWTYTDGKGDSAPTVMDGYTTFLPPVEIKVKEDGNQIAVISSNKFVIYPDVPESRFFHMVYSDFMNMNMADWDSGYRIVTESGTTVAAIDKVDVSIPENGGLDREEYSFNAVLAYDTELLSYIVIAFDQNYTITEEQLIYIAQSIILSRTPSAEPIYGLGRQADSSALSAFGIAVQNAEYGAFDHNYGTYDDGRAIEGQSIFVLPEIVSTGGSALAGAEQINAEMRAEWNAACADIFAAFQDDSYDGKFVYRLNVEIYSYNQYLVLCYNIDAGYPNTGYEAHHHMYYYNMSTDKAYTIDELLAEFGTSLNGLAAAQINYDDNLAGSKLTAETIKAVLPLSDTSFRVMSDPNESVEYDTVYATVYLDTASADSGEEKISAYRPPEATELLLIHRIFASNTYLLSFRTEPKSVCVYYTSDDGASYTKLDVVIPDGYEYDTAEAVSASGGGGSGEACFFVRLTQGDKTQYLRFDNYSYGDASDWLNFAYGATVPADEVPGS